VLHAVFLRRMEMIEARQAAVTAARAAAMMGASGGLDVLGLHPPGCVKARRGVARKMLVCVCGGGG
jgi:hypothetical protein